MVPWKGLSIFRDLLSHSKLHPSRQTPFTDFISLLRVSSTTSGCVFVTFPTTRHVYVPLMSWRRSRWVLTYTLSSLIELPMWIWYLQKKSGLFPGNIIFGHKWELMANTNSGFSASVFMNDFDNISISALKRWGQGNSQENTHLKLNNTAHSRAINLSHLRAFVFFGGKSLNIEKTKRKLFYFNNWVLLNIVNNY